MNNDAALNPYAPPTADLPAGASDSRYSDRRYTAIREAGGVIAIQKDVTLPEICVKCGTREDLVTRKERFVYTPPWAYFALLLNIIVLLIVALIVQKKGKLTLSACAACHAKWKQANVAWGFAILWLISAIVGTVVAGVNEAGVIALLLLASGIAAPVVVHNKLRAPATVRAKKVDKELIRLVGVHELAQEAIVSEAMA